jgi:tRNA A-37 threonylcarbamoyl transferase component Bud32
MLAAGGYTGAWERTGVVNEQGKDVISMRRKKVVGGIADLVDMASELGASLASANDVETAVKHAGIRSIVDEVGRAHDAILILAEECASVDSVEKFVSSYDRIWRAAKALIVAVRPLPVAGGGAWEEQLAGDSPRDIVAEVERRLEEEAMPDMAELDALEAAERKREEKREEKEMKRIEREELRAQKAAQKEAAAVAAAAAAAAEEQALKEAAERALVVHEDAGASKIGTIFGDLLALDDSKRPAPGPSSADQRPMPGMSDAAALAAAFGAPPEAVDGRFLALPAPEDGGAAHYGSDDDGYDGGYEHFRAQQEEDEARREQERRDISTGAWASRSGYGNMALVTAGPSCVPGKKHPVFCQCAMCAQAEAQQAAAISAERAQDGYSDDGNPQAAAAFQPTTRRQQSLYDSEVEDDIAAGQHNGFGTKANGGDSHGDNRRGGYSDDDAGSYQSVTYSVGDGAEHGESNSATGLKTTQPKIDLSSSIHVSSDSRPHSLLPTMLRGPPGNEKPRPVLGLNMRRLRTGDKIGEGSFGIVYKGEYQGETVAIKKMHKQLLKSPEAVSEFIAEVNLMSELKHPNLLRCVAASIVPPDIMLLTEFMKRGTLFDVLYRERIKLTWALIRKIALQAATGMCYLHAHRILHRDLKSSNLLVDGSYNVKLGDFGLAKPDIGVDPRGGISGTYQYMAPEILRGDSPSTLSDVYSFGVIVWEMVSGEPPYLGMDPLEAGRRVLEEDMRPIIPASCLRPYAAIIQACWATAPAARPSFAEVVGMIETTTK